MAFDPYANDAPSVADPGNNLINITPDNDDDIVVGIKALRITNKTEDFVAVHVITTTGDTASFEVPPLCVWIEPLRARRLLEATGDVTVQGYTDVARP